MRARRQGPPAAPPRAPRLVCPTGPHHGIRASTNAGPAAPPTSDLLVAKSRSLDLSARRGPRDLVSRTSRRLAGAGAAGRLPVPPRGSSPESPRRTIAIDGIRLRCASSAEGLVVSNAIMPVGRKGVPVAPAGWAVSRRCAAADDWSISVHMSVGGAHCQRSFWTVWGAGARRRRRRRFMSVARRATAGFAIRPTRRRSRRSWR
jgi:hypothetical protein